VSSQIIYAKCGNVWRGDCLLKQFEIAIKDETKYPASCCKQELDLVMAQKLFPSDL
jgi:hypothetical protein